MRFQACTRLGIAAVGETLPSIVIENSLLADNNSKHLVTMSVNKRLHANKKQEIEGKFALLPDNDYCIGSCYKVQLLLYV